MPYQKFLAVVGMILGVTTGLDAQQQPQPSPATPAPVVTPEPQARTTPFIADPTQAEIPNANAAPTPAPDLSFPTSPTAPPSQQTNPSAATVPAEAGVARAEPVSEREVITRLQIFLDQRSFSPGKIDGKWGEFVAKALQRFQRANGLRATGQIDPAMQQQLQQIFPIYTTYTLTPDDLTRVGNIPYKPAEEAKVRALLYRSLTEFIAERYHAGQNFIARLNSDKKVDNLKAGDTIRVPNVPPFQIENLKEIGSLPVKPEFAKRVIKVDTRFRMLDIMEGDKIVGSYPITPGSQKLPAPIGTWKIVGIATMPWFRWDEAMLNHGERSENFYNLPPGPRNPVGIAWIGLNKRGIGIHGTNSPDTIGRSGSHGCIRLANWDAARVINQVTEGMTVQIF
jgi:lipoprotein-anchoring transpeptidase ErfK/SrfK